MKKVLILANNDVGLYKFRKELIQKLLDNNVEVYISLPDGEFVKELEKIGCVFIDTPIDRRGINPLKDIKILLKYYRIFKKIRPDKVVTYTIKPNIYGGLISRLFKTDYAINITGLGTAFQNENFLKKLVVFLYKVSCKKAKTVFFENKANCQIFLDNKIINEQQAVVLNGAGVNTGEYKFSEYPNNKKCNFLFVGRVMKEKGVEELFYAAKRLKDEGLNCSVSIVGPCEEEYHCILEELQSEDILEYFGAQKDVKPFYSKCNCFVLPSYHEGMANTLLEASAMGRPSITSNIPGCRESVVDGKSGFLCKVQDAEDLFEKMVEFCSLSFDEKRERGRLARMHIEENFDKKVVVNTTWEALKN